MTLITPDFCFRLNGRGAGQPLDLDKLPDDLKAPVWIHIDYKDEENQELVKKMKLNRLVTENLLDADTSPRYFSNKKGFLVVMRGVNTQKNAEIDDMIALHMWIEKGRILTLSHRSVPAVRRVRALLKRGRGPKSAVDCFLMLAHFLTENISSAIAKIDDEVDEIEDEVIEQDHYDDKELRVRVSQIRHKIIGLRRYIVPQRDMIKVLRNVAHPVLKEEHLLQLSEIYMDLAKAVEDLNFVRDHSNVTQEELDAKTSINISRTMYIMSIVMVIFTPMTFLTGLLGANIGGIPFGSDPKGFYVISGVLMIVALLQLTFLKKMRWF